MSASFRPDGNAGRRPARGRRAALGSRLALLLALPLLAPASGCASTDRDPPRTLPTGNPVQERLRVEETLRDYERAENSGQVGELLALFTEQAWLFLPGEEPLRGALAVGERYLTWLGRGRTAVELRLREVTHDGALAIAHGRLIGSWLADDAGEPRRERFESDFLMVLERRSPGWRITHLALQPAGRVR